MGRPKTMKFRTAYNWNENKAQEFKTEKVIFEKNKKTGKIGIKEKRNIQEDIQAADNTIKLQGIFNPENEIIRKELEQKAIEESGEYIDISDVQYLELGEMETRLRKLRKQEELAKNNKNKLARIIKEKEKLKRESLAQGHIEQANEINRSQTKTIIKKGDK